MLFSTRSITNRRNGSTLPGTGNRKLSAEPQSKWTVPTKVSSDIRRPTGRHPRNHGRFTRSPRRVAGSVSLMAWVRVISTVTAEPTFFVASGWWEQPESLASDSEWTFHPAGFGGGGAQMYAYDVNGDGLNDVITSLQAHGHGLAWFEQFREGNEIKFREHLIMGREPKDNQYGLVFSQLHALDLVDMDGDGLKDIVTGKRFWAHGPGGDAEPGAPAVVYWFKLVRNADKSIDWVPQFVDDDSGVGTQVLATDVNGDGLPDIVVGNKKGTFVHLHETKKVSKEEWEKAQPKASPTAVFSSPAPSKSQALPLPSARTNAQSSNEDSENRKRPSWQQRQQTPQLGSRGSARRPRWQTVEHGLRNGRSARLDRHW